MTKPIIGITMGDPAGIGPEVTLKALQDPGVRSSANIVVYGSMHVLERTCEDLKLDLHLQSVSSVDDPESSCEASIVVIDRFEIDPEELVIGQISAACGAAAAAYIENAIEAALDRKIDAIVTGPIHKKALVEAGYPFLGHTELLADRCGVEDTAMMLATPGRGPDPAWLRVTHASAHIAFRDIVSALSQKKLLRTIGLTHGGVQFLGIQEPRLALAALNPHASDNGLMGDEEESLLQPTVSLAQSQGYDLRGPVPADTVFLRAIEGEFDAVIALYHDQGHIPIKTYGFERAVNITLGLPITRTSVDHGTAFDIAGKQLADPGSMLEAIKLAVEIASNRQRML
ncbi:MAG: 4-hydroxythreonine-4-phosphate dehydrogenase PdxA [Anaerolineales bacterium]